MARPKSTQKTTKPNEPELKKVRERNVQVRIRSGPGVNFDHVNGEYLGKGIFEIDKIESGIGSTSGWGHLVNGKGWVALDFLDFVD